MNDIGKVNNAQLPEAFLRKLLRLYTEQEVPVRWIEQTEQTPYDSLIVRFDEIGNRGAVVDLEMCFVPGMEQFEQEGVYILQSFASIGGQVASGAEAQLLEATATVNTRLPLGAFGLFTDNGTLYFKHNAMLHREWLLSDGAIQGIDRQNGMLLHQFHLFAEPLSDVADGRLTADEALRDLPIL